MSHRRVIFEVEYEYAFLKELLLFFFFLLNGGAFNRKFFNVSAEDESFYLFFCNLEDWKV